MKRIACLVILALILFGLCSCAAPEPDQAESPELPVVSAQPIWVGVVVDTDSVNLRLAPSQEARIIDNVLAGTMLQAAGSEAEDGWYQVTLRGDTAYVHADYLYVSEWAGEQEEFTRATVRREIDQTNLLSAPDEGGEALATVRRYHSFVVLDEEAEDGWCQVDYKGSPAYLPLSAVTLEQVCLGDVLL